MHLLLGYGRAAFLFSFIHAAGFAYYCKFERVTWDELEVAKTEGEKFGFGCFSYLCERCTLDLEFGFLSVFRMISCFLGTDKRRSRKGSIDSRFVIFFYY